MLAVPFINCSPNQENFKATRCLPKPSVCFNENTKILTCRTKRAINALKKTKDSQYHSHLEQHIIITITYDMQFRNLIIVYFCIHIKCIYVFQKNKR